MHFGPLVPETVHGKDIYRTTLTMHRATSSTSAYCHWSAVKPDCTVSTVVTQACQTKREAVTWCMCIYMEDRVLSLSVTWKAWLHATLGRSYMYNRPYMYEHVMRMLLGGFMSDLRACPVQENRTRLLGASGLGECMA